MEIPDFDPEEVAEAWATAQRIVREHPLAAWMQLPFEMPDDLNSEGRARLLKQVYFLGALYAISTAELTARGDGLNLHYPALFGADDAVRCFSFETLLPFINDERVSEREARWLAERFRGLAKICEAHAERIKAG